jgi:hypothetical protein
MGSKSEARLNTLFCSIGEFSFIKSDYANKLTLTQPIGRIRQFAIGSNGQSIEVSEAVCLEFYVSGILLCDGFYVVPELSHDAIIGAATMRKWRIRPDFEKGCLEVKPRVEGRIRIGRMRKFD